MAQRRSVIVTGGASGLGKIMSRHFASLGDAVTIFDVNAADGEAVAADLDAAQKRTHGAQGAGGAVRFEKCDVSSWTEQKAAFKAVYDAVGRVDVVVANAGVAENARSWVVPSIEEDDDELEKEPALKVLDINLNGVVYSVKLAQYYMRRNTPDATTGSRGAIICTASNVGLYPFPPAPLYAASKHAVVGLVRSLGPFYAMAHIGIRINALAPAVLATNIAGTDALFNNMILTPDSTLIKGVEKLLNDVELNGQVLEIHGDNVTVRPPHDVVDADSRHNLAEFVRLGYGQ
ncbi:15-hydroxyprostaglandin dehydrogenase [Xylaria bambusicola]|uniref:15-hydroxyprostaglandin dehydrogenase n=1 Tax=Xylaria bambusicola TaxID=326684 RepID=UPI002007978E|nr:15-hydroxyprostaglandin dehydrogenase [Xylaria bambusicola]KAI0516966.1 15-hydroxyprostaglandin dehydrogenase [Xylaria bambusicola]